MDSLTVHQHRRLLLKFLLGSPLLSLTGCSTSDTNQKEIEKVIDLLSQPSDAINVFDFEAFAKQKLPPAHFGYLSTGVNDDLTLKANREAFSKYKLRMRRLTGVTDVDMSVNLFGKKWPTPIVLSPVGSQRAFHEDGELATARAAQSRNHLQILSTVTTSSVEDVAQARGGPVWYQLYALTDWNGTLDMIHRAEDAGSEVLVFTVDLSGGTDNRETLKRMKKLDTRTCTNCHSDNQYARKPMVSPTKNAKFASDLNWDFVDKIKNATKMKLVIKGIETSEDAQLCLAHQANGIIVSNHGGRASETSRGTLECLPEVLSVVKGSVPVLIDGGFRRGTDIFKALALGASAVCVGRPYIWGLSTFGQAGVEAVLRILTDELAVTMKHAGTASINNITAAYLTA
jgi:4-hydroxymandelate oxidase